MGEYLKVCSRVHSGLIRLIELITLTCWTEFCNRHHRFHIEEHVYYILSRRLALFCYKKAITGLC